MSAVISKRHSDIQESCKTYASGAATAIMASRRMVGDSSAFRGRLAFPYDGTSLFGGAFMSYIESGAHNQEQLTQVCRLTATDGSSIKPGWVGG